MEHITMSPQRPMQVPTATVTSSPTTSSLNTVQSRMSALMLLQKAANMRSPTSVMHHDDNEYSSCVIRRSDDFKRDLLAAASFPALDVDESNDNADVVPPRPTKKTKRVHFAEMAYEVTVPRTDPMDADKLWWDEASLVQRRMCDKVLVEQNAIYHNPLYHESILYLMLSFKKEGQCREKLMERVKIVRDTDVRGLEQRIVHQIKINRHVACKEILALQRKLRKEGLLDRCNEMGTSMLRHKSLKMSRTARQLAFRLAQADQLDA